MDLLQETFEASRDKVDELANDIAMMVPKGTSIRIVMAALVCVMKTCVEYGSADSQSKARAAIRQMFAEPGPMQ